MLNLLHVTVIHLYYYTLYIQDTSIQPSTIQDSEICFKYYNMVQLLLFIPTCIYQFISLFNFFDF